MSTPRSAPKPWRLFVYNEAFKQGANVLDRQKHTEGQTPRALLSLQLMILFEERIRVFYIWMTVFAIIFKAAVFSRHWDPPVVEEVVLLILFILFSLLKTHYGNAGNKQEQTFSLVYFTGLMIPLTLVLGYFLKQQVVVLQVDYFLNLTMIIIGIIQIALALLLGIVVAPNVVERMALIAASGCASFVKILVLFVY